MKLRNILRSFGVSVISRELPRSAREGIYDVLVLSVQNTLADVVGYSSTGNSDPKKPLVNKVTTGNNDDDTSVFQL